MQLDKADSMELTHPKFWFADIKIVYLILFQLLSNRLTSQGLFLSVVHVVVHAAVC